MTDRFDIQSFLRRAIPALIAIDILLVVVGVLLYPSALGEGGILGLVADIAILLIYGYLALASPIGVTKVDPGLLTLSVWAGLVGALLLCADLLSGYLIAPSSGTSAFTSLSAYGIFLVLLLVLGVVGAVRTGRVISGLSTALWAVLVTVLIWFFCEFASYYLLGTSGHGAEFVRQEMQADFARSGSTNYQGFVMSDFFGAGFFHPLLMLILGSILGLLGGLVGRVLRPRSRQTAS